MKDYYGRGWDAYVKPSDKDKDILMAQADAIEKALSVPGTFEALAAEVRRLTGALEDIDAVAIDHGHHESAARTMKEHARSALKYRT